MPGSSAETVSALPTPLGYLSHATIRKNKQCSDTEESKSCYVKPRPVNSVWLFPILKDNTDRNEESHQLLSQTKNLDKSSVVQHSPLPRPHCPKEGQSPRHHLEQPVKPIPLFAWLNTNSPPVTQFTDYHQECNLLTWDSVRYPASCP